jgi:hypothetical protein
LPTIIAVTDNKHVKLSVPVLQTGSGATFHLYRGPGGNDYQTFTDGVFYNLPAPAGTGNLHSATAHFVSSDINLMVVGDAFTPGTVIKSLSPTTPTTDCTLSLPVLFNDSTQRQFSIMRGNNRGAWSGAVGTSYAVGDYAFVLVNGVQVWAWCNAAHTNQANAVITVYNETYWMLDVCLKKLGDCQLHFGSTNPLPYGAFPGADKLQ